jgi:hypothetical protein
LKASGNIVLGNALGLDWTQVCPKRPDDEVYVCGNPPFLGHGRRSEAQLEEMERVLGSDIQSYKSLDYVGCWFFLSAEFITDTNAKAAFVATNSISQGKQAGLLWPALRSHGVEIDYAYQSFIWKNSAKDKAGVHVVIVGITAEKTSSKRLYKWIGSDWHCSVVQNISPYLVSGGNIVVSERSKPFQNQLQMKYGNMPNDAGNLLLTPKEKDDLLQAEPTAEKWLKRLLGADEFIKGKERWCLWLKRATAKEIDGMPLVKKRVDRVREIRRSSKKKSTQNLANVPHIFAEIRQPELGGYILVPRVTSERREYAPIGFFGSDIIVTDLVNIIPEGTLYDFGVLSTRIHMDWLHLVGGRLESRFRYSAKLVYNTFPWPDCTPKQRTEIEALADEVLLAREDTFDWTMAEMYDPDKMPKALREAHGNLDEAVEQLYRRTPFRDQAERQEFLLARYEKLIKQEAGVSA